MSAKMIKVQCRYLQNQKLRWGSNWRFVQELEPKSVFLGAPGKSLMIDVSFISIQYSWTWFKHGLSIFGSLCFSLMILIHHWYLHATTRKHSIIQISWDSFAKYSRVKYFFEIFCKIFGGEIFDAGKMTWAMVLPFWCSRGKKKLAVINNSHFLSSLCAKSQF